MSWWMYDVIVPFSFALGWWGGSLAVRLRAYLRRQPEGIQPTDAAIERIAKAIFDTHRPVSEWDQWCDDKERWRCVARTVWPHLRTTLSARELDRAAETIFTALGATVEWEAFYRDAARNAAFYRDAARNAWTAKYAKECHDAIA